MKYSIVSDIHANYEALESVLDDLTDSKLIVLGDVIGYGAEPGRCIDLVRSLGCPCLRGNHEQVQADWSTLKTFNPVARQSAEYTRPQLTQAQQEWIAGLPFEGTEPAFYYSHGSPFAPDRFHYLLPGETNSPWIKKSFERLEQMTAAVAFHGHTHLPGMFILESGRIRYQSLNEDCLIRLDPACRYIINGGSIGQPRNADPRAQYIVFDDADFTIEKRSVCYDTQAAARKIRECGLPSILWQRILEGL